MCNTHTLLHWRGAAASACAIRNWVCEHENASARRHTLTRACECADIILMFPDVVLHQFHIKAKESEEPARYKLLKQCNKTLQGQAACVSVCTCALFTAAMAYLSLCLLTKVGYTPRRQRRSFLIDYWKLSSDKRMIPSFISIFIVLHVLLPIFYWPTHVERCSSEAAWEYANPALGWISGR